MTCPECGREAEEFPAPMGTRAWRCEFCGYHLRPNYEVIDGMEDWEDYSVEPFDEQDDIL